MKRRKIFGRSVPDLSAERMQPWRWLCAAYASGLLLPVILALTGFHQGYGMVLMLFGLPLVLIGSYGILAVRRVFFYPDALVDLTDRRLVLVFIVPIALYMAIVAGRLTLLMIAFAASFF